MKQKGEVCAALASVTKFAPCGSHLESGHHFNELLVPGSHLHWLSGSGVFVRFLSYFSDSVRIRTLSPNRAKRRESSQVLGHWE